jgi:hypothetical protein
MEDPWLEDNLKKDPLKTIAAVVLPLKTDVWIYRGVVLALGLAVLIALIGAIVLASTGQQVPDVIVALGSAAVG